MHLCLCTALLLPYALALPMPCTLATWVTTPMRRGRRYCRSAMRRYRRPRLPPPPNTGRGYLPEVERLTTRGRGYSLAGGSLFNFYGGSDSLPGPSVLTYGGPASFCETGPSFKSVYAAGVIRITDRGLGNAGVARILARTIVASEENLGRSLTATSASDRSPINWRAGTAP